MRRRRWRKIRILWLAAALSVTANAVAAAAAGNKGTAVDAQPLPAF
ncbi:hypothetical protein ACFFK0_14795 [Paenibacillus chartarius]|uniref:Uncharacterized protein n=1 Tax=Paenibacillus chartarius TaxID=747481 RepID=A0ABV6DM39_9BACL